MLILALDTSGKVASCALLRGCEVLAFEARDSMLDHSRTLLLLVQQLLEKHGLCPGDVDLFAAVTGPGSFTGVRIGVAAVKGFGWTQGRPCAGVSSLMAMAFCAPSDGPVCCRVTARPGEYYAALFDRQGQKVIRLSDDAVLAEAELAELCARHPGCTVLTDEQTALGAALAAAQLAQQGPIADCHALAPTYLKKPQAEREREARLAGSFGSRSEQMNELG